MKEEITKKIPVPQGISASLDGMQLTLKGPQGETQRTFPYPAITISTDDGSIILHVRNATKREKRMIGTYESHIKNMVQGVQEKFIYTLKICSGHFPMNVSVSGNTLAVKNFLGEKHPRKVEFSPQASVKINGPDIEVMSVSKELAGQTAGKIEKLCQITNRDRRIFQDGIYITNKA
jgi:large subunit ribosomal protein L6